MKRNQVMPRAGIWREQRRLIRHLDALASLLDASSAYHMYIKDPESLEFIWTTERCASMYGRRAKDMIGLSDRDLFEPDIAAAFFAEDRRVVQNDEPVVHIHSKSLFRPAPRWVIDTKFLHSDKAGNPIALVGTASIMNSVAPREGDFFTDAHWQHRLEEGIRNSELVLHFQPQRDADGKLSKVEALVRWRKDGRLLAPAEFIPQAEQCGLIAILGCEVIRLAIATLRDWSSHPELSKLQLSVNISPRQLDHSLVQLLETLLGAYGVSPSRLRLELTESAFERDQHQGTVESVIRALTGKLGISLSLDDFGKDYSCLSKLERYPIAEIKIDKAFVDRLFLPDGALNKRGSGIIQSIVNLGHTIDCCVVAEGIESDAQHLALKSLGVDYFQGYLGCLHKPVDAEGLLRLVNGS